MILKNSVRKKSEKAVSALSQIVDDLLLANVEADVIIDEQQKEIDSLTVSNASLIAQRQRNETIAAKIQKLLGANS